MFNTEDCVSFLTCTAAKKLSDEFNKRLQKENITRVQWIALFYIGKYNEISQRELSNFMNVKESSIVRLLDRMEKEELTYRVKSDSDRRISKILLTDKGKNLNKSLLPLGESFQKDATNGLTIEELDIFKKVLTKMIENIC